MKRIFSVLLVLSLGIFPVGAFGQSNPDAPGFGLGFGGAIAAGQGELLVGAAPVGWPRGDEPAGKVYLFRKTEAGNWTEKGAIQADDGALGDNFGRALALQGKTLVVGAPGRGAAYVFSKGTDGTWSQAGMLMPSDLDSGADFAGMNGRASRTRSVAVIGDRVAATAYKAGERMGTGNGVVHIYRQDEDGWVEESKLMADNAEEPGGYGWAIAATEDALFVSAPSAGENGLIYVYRLSDEGKWSETARIEGTNLPAGSGYGLDLVAQGSRLFVGAPRLDGTGGILVFESSQKNNWKEVGRLSGFMKATRSRGGIGAALAVSDNTLLTAAAGSVMAFQMDEDGQWSSMHVLKPRNDREMRAYGRGLAVSAGVAVVGSPMADYEEGIATVYEQTESMGAWQQVSTLETEVAHLASITGDRIACEEGKAAMFECEKVDLISFVSVDKLAENRGVKMTDIWGWEDPQTGKEYVLQARTDGVSFVDISDPYHPVVIGQLMKTETSPGSAWRDVKVYKDHAFIVADGAADHGMQIFDLTQLRDVPAAEMPVDFEVTAHYKGIHSTHNVVINEETGYAYAVGNRAGGETCGGQLHMINIQNPTEPEFAGCFTHPNAGGTHDSQCVVYRGPDLDYAGREICLNSNGSSFIIADVTDKENPKTLAHVTYPNLAYTHQGWLTEDQRYFYMNDELDELNGNVENTRTLIWDIEDLEDPLLAKEFMLDSKASDHNLYVKGNLMYQSNYQAGLRILDISDPLNPVESAHFDTVPWGEDQPGFGGSWSNYPYFKSGIIAVSSRGEGLFLVRKQDVDI